MKTKIIVIKIGTSVLFTKRRRLDEFLVHSYIEQIQRLEEKGYGVILIISGAVALGASEVIESCSKSTRGGIGQAILISKLLSFFQQKKRCIAQILLTRDLFQLHKPQVKQTLFEMMSHTIIPILNENDVIDLNSFGGNDVLAVEIAQLMHARLIILSSFKTNGLGVGGGETKMEALRHMREFGLTAHIQDGRTKDCMTKGI